MNNQNDMETNRIALDKYNRLYDNESFKAARDKIDSQYETRESTAVGNMMLDTALVICGYTYNAYTNESVPCFIAYYRDMTRESQALVDSFLNRFTNRAAIVNSIRRNHLLNSDFPTAQIDAVLWPNAEPSGNDY